MNDRPDTENPEKKQMGGELVIPIGALLFTFYYFWTIIDVPWTAQVSAFFVGTILIGLIVAFIARTIRQVRRTPEEGLFDSLLAEHHYLGYTRPVGEHLKYLGWAGDRPVGTLVGGAGPRPRFRPFRAPSSARSTPPCRPRPGP